MPARIVWADVTPGISMPPGARVAVGAVSLTGEPYCIIHNGAVVATITEPHAGGQVRFLSGIIVMPEDELRIEVITAGSELAAAVAEAERIIAEDDEE